MALHRASSVAALPTAGSGQSPEPSTASFPAADWPRAPGSHSADLEAWLDAGCADSPWWHSEVPSSAEAAVASQAQLLSQCDSLWDEPGEPEVQQATLQSRSLHQPAEQYSPHSAPATPVISPAPSELGSRGFNLGNVGLLAQDEHSADSRSQTEQLDDSCGGSTASHGLADIAQGTPAKRMLSPVQQPGLPLPRRESQPFSSASARGASVLSETVLTSDDEHTRAGNTLSPVCVDAGGCDLPDDVAHALGDRNITSSLAELDPGLLDSDDPEHSADYQSDEPDSQDDDSSDLDTSPDLRFCVNCTARLRDSEYCMVIPSHLHSCLALITGTYGHTHPPALGEQQLMPRLQSA